MKKATFLITLIVNSFTIPLPSNKFFGPAISKLKMCHILKNKDQRPFVINKYPTQNIYQLRTLTQKGPSCTIHSFKNVFYGVNAFNSLNFLNFKEKLPKLFNEKIVNQFRKVIAEKLKKPDVGIKSGLADFEMKHAWPAIINSMKHLPIAVFYHIFDGYIVPDSYDYLLKEYPTDLDKKYEKVSKYLATIDFIDKFEKERIIELLYHFKKSKLQTLGLSLVYSRDITYFAKNFSFLFSKKKYYHHAISLIIRKVGTSFEYFVIDSNNNESAYWLQGVQRIRFILGLPLKILEKFTIS